MRESAAGELVADSPAKSDADRASVELAAGEEMGDVSFAEDGGLATSRSGQRKEKTEWRSGRREGFDAGAGIDDGLYDLEDHAELAPVEQIDMVDDVLDVRSRVCAVGLEELEVGNDREFDDALVRVGGGERRRPGGGRIQDRVRSRGAEPGCVADVATARRKC